MAREKVTFKNDSNRIVVRDDQNKFKPVLYSNLCIPSYVHGYSIAIEYMKKWFLSKLPDNYFKYVHINGKHMFDDYARWNKQNVKREKPYLAITPTIDYDYDRELLDIHNMGADLYLRRTDVQRSFFRDTKNKYYLSVRLQELKMNFNFRIRVSTRAEQLDLFKRMEILYRVGATQGEYISADFPIPKDVLLNIADGNGFEIKDEFLKEPINFLSYLNKYSDLPITYKLRTVNSKFEYFLRLSDLYAHIAVPNKIQLDDGEREGQLDNNFAIDMEAELRLPIPQFFAFYNEKPLSYSINIDNDRTIDMYSLPFFVIPEENDKEWQQMINTSYELDPLENSIDIYPLFKGTNIEKTMKYCLDNFISPLCFMEVSIYRLNEEENKYYRENIKLDFNTNILSFENKNNSNEIIFIAVYVDKSYMNNTITVIEDLERNRIASAKIDMGSNSITNDMVYDGRGTVSLKEVKNNG